jgi:alpha-beta hydrolase superfamily lysophospholipase
MTQAPSLKASHVLGADGMHLPMSVWLPAARPVAVVLALHGFNDYRQAFADLGETMSRQGVAVYAYDQRGFGASAYRGLWPGTERLVGDAVAVLDLLRARYPGTPVYLLGESMGAAVLLAALDALPAGAAAGLVLVSPAVWARTDMPWYQRGALWLAAHAAPGLELSGRGLRRRASDNREALKKLHDDPLVIKSTRVDTLWGLADLMDTAVAAGPKLAMPALILHGVHDQIIPPEAVSRWISYLPHAGPWRQVTYPDGWHMLTRDLGGSKVIADIAAWLKAPGGPLPSGLENPVRTFQGSAPSQ